MPANEDEPAPLRYEVVLTEPAEIDIDAAHTRLAHQLSLDYADRWQDGLLTAISELSNFPKRHAIALENDIYDVTIRRLLYFGPNRKSGSHAYRVLYHVVEPTAYTERGIVRILHVWHSSRTSPH